MKRYEKEKIFSNSQISAKLIRHYCRLDNNGKELLETAKANELTRKIEIILFHKAFPVDIRHNSKIFREKLTIWAEKRMI